MQHNKIYQAHIPDLDKNVKSDKFTKNVLAPDKSTAFNKIKDQYNSNVGTVQIAPEYKQLKELFDSYKILTVDKLGNQVKLKIENNRRKKGYDIFVVTFTGYNNDNVKTILRVKDLSRKYGYLCNGQPNKNMEHYEV